MANKTHGVLVIAFPVQGHINPMFQFSKRLALKGLQVTFLIPTSASKPLHLVSGSSSVVKIEQIPDESGEANGGEKPSLDSYFRRFKASISESLASVIRKHQCCEGDSAKLLVYDSVMPWALDIAIQHGMTGAPFFTQSCTANVVYYHLHKGTLRLPLSEEASHEQGRGHIVCEPPVMSILELRDLPDFVGEADRCPAVLKLVVDQFSNLARAKWLLFNTFAQLEDEVVKWLGSHWPTLTIGPTLPSMYLDKRIKDDQDYGVSLFKTDAKGCMKWLASKDANSVVYVSFGSLTSLGQEQMGELASGLRRMKRNILWAMRESEEDKLPCNFMREIKEDDKGMVVGWCNQLEVLNHDSVGCFITQCGWNSTMEGISMGVPMVVMPQFADQLTNAAFVVEVWRVGLRVKADKRGIMTGEEIERCVNEIMQEEGGKELRRNSFKWKQMARQALDEGGSSDRSMVEFTESIMYS